MQTTHPISRQQLVLDFQPRVRTAARRLLRKRALPVDLDELISAGNVGLLEAANRYDPRIANSFEAFADRRVSGAMMDYVRAQIWAPRSVATRARELDGAFDLLRRRLGREPTREEMARHLGISLAAYDARRASAARRQVVSGDQQAYEEGGDTLLTQQADEGEAAEDRCIANEQVAWVRAAIHRLPCNERIVLTLYYLEEQSLSAVAARLRLSEGRISQIHHQALRRMRVLHEVDESIGRVSAVREPSQVVDDGLDRLLAK